MVIESILVSGGVLAVFSFGKIIVEAREEYLDQRKKYLNGRAEEPYFWDIWRGEVRDLLGLNKYKSTD